MKDLYQQIYQILLLWCLILCFPPRSQANNQDFTFALTCEKMQNATDVNTANGIGRITVNGGAPPFTFQVLNAANISVSSGSIPVTNASVEIPNLAGGTYSVIVSDLNGTQTCSFIIGLDNCDLMVNLTNTTVACAGDLGDLNPIISGGVAPLTYLWSNGATTPSIHDVPTGNYTLLVTDNAGCSHFIAAAVIAPNPLKIFPIPTNASDFQTQNGSVKFNINGGNAPFNLILRNTITGIVFSGTTLPSPVTISNLLAGNYEVEVEDAKGCQVVGEFQIKVNNCLLAVSVEDIDTECLHADNQLLAVSNNQGIPPFRYKWTDGSTSQSINNLSPGVYGVTITDAIGCSHATTGEVIGNEMLTLSCSVLQDVSIIGNNDGEISIKISHGTPVYMVLLENISRGETRTLTITTAGITIISGLSSGNYRLTLSDQNNCTTECSFEIKDPACLLSVQVDDVALSCTQQTGTLTANVSGGNPPYQYLWNNGITSPSNPNLVAGMYSVTVKDALNCEKTTTGSILESFRDADGDGYYVGCVDYSIYPGPDCDDNDNTVYPGAPELCDGKDNNCNGQTDEGLPDLDGDGRADCYDLCPNDPYKTDPGICGCGVVEDTEDYDGDGVIGCEDGCPNDPFKTSPGQCGCGASEDTKDHDGDGAIGCEDECPYDKNKISQGYCGCGVPESPDSDGDGVVDCLDECPNNALKTQKGICGCEAPGITHIELKNFSACNTQGTSDNSDDFFYADVYIYFDADPERGGLTLRGDLDYYYNFPNGINNTTVVLPNQIVKSSNPSIYFVAEYKGNEGCNYVYSGPNPNYNCSQNVCDGPSDIISNVNGNHVLLSWQSKGYAVSNEYKYRIVGTNSWIAQWTDQNSCTLCDLDPSASYEYQIRSLCASGYSSAYEGGQFKTRSQTAACFGENNSAGCTIIDTRFINIRQCHDRGTIYQSDDYFYADLLIYFENIPTSGDLVIEGNLEKRIPVADISNPKVHHIEKLKIYERNGYLSLITYFSNEPACRKEIEYVIPRNPCYSGEILPDGSRIIEESDGDNLVDAGVQISIGPNPVQNELKVNYAFKFAKKNTQILVYNFLGQQEIRTEMSGTVGQTIVDVSSLDNGLYYLSIQNGGIWRTIKFIKESFK